MLFSLAVLLIGCGGPVPCDSLMDYGDLIRSQGKLPDALVYFEQAAASCPERSEPYWRISRSLLELADDEYNAEGRGMNERQRLDQFKKALDYTFISISKRKTDHRAWEICSVAYAAVLNLSGLKTKALLADSVRICAEESARLDPTNDTPWHILGRWHYEVSRLGWLVNKFSHLFFGGAPEGSYAKAEEYFRRALAASPAPVNRYWLALALEAQNKDREAREQYRAIVENASKQMYHNDYVFVKKAKRKLR